MTRSFLYQKILGEISQVLNSVIDEEAEMVSELLKNSQRIYVIGEGRSGLVAKAFAMRLVHLRKRCFVVGETVTPALRKHDVLLAVSGSGETRSVVETAQTARRLGGLVIGVTAKRESSLLKQCNYCMVIPAKIMKKSLKSFELRELEGEALEPPLGSLFEVSAMVFFECVVMNLMQKLKIGEQQMYRIHPNL